MQVHGFHREARDALATTKTEPLEVHQVNNEPIERELESRLEESILALSKSVEDADLPTIFRLLECLIADLRVVGEHSWILGVIDVFADELELGGEDEFTLVESLQHVQSQSHVVNIKESEL